MYYTRGGAALKLFFEGGVPQETLKWGSKELTTRVKYRVLGTKNVPGSVKNRVYRTTEQIKMRSWELHTPITTLCRLRSRALYHWLCIVAEV